MEEKLDTIIRLLSEIKGVTPQNVNWNSNVEPARVNWNSLLADDTRIQTLKQLFYLFRAILNLF